MEGGGAASALPRPYPLYPLSREGGGAYRSYIYSGLPDGLLDIAGLGPISLVRGANGRGFYYNLEDSGRF